MRAVASLAMRMRVVASIEVSSSLGFNGSICADGSWAAGKGRDRLSLFSPPLRQALCALPN